MRNKNILKYFLTLVFSTSFLISSTYYGNSLKEYVMKLNHDYYITGTEIGTIDISGLTKKEAEDKIDEAVKLWGNKPIIVQFSEFTMNAPNQLIQFDIKNSIDQAIDGQKNSLIVSVNEPIYQDFFAEIDIPILKHINHQQVKQELLTLANQLDHHNINLFTYITKSEEKEAIIAKSESTLQKQQQDLIKWVGKMKELNISSQQPFSLASLFNEKNKQLSNDSLNALSSIIYQVILPTNFEILERHKGLQVPTNVELGFEAKIVPEKMDFQFYNPNKSEYKLKLEMVNKTLHVSLIGQPFYYDYKIRKTPTKTYKPRTVIQYSALMGIDEYKVLEEGENGYNLNLYRDIYDQQGSVIETQFISEDFYPPVHRVIVEGLQENSNLLEYEEKISTE